MNKTSSAIVRTLLLGTSCLCALSLLPAQADPTGGVVIGGSATITSHGNTTTIDQTTNKAVIDWNSFSISAGGTVRFNQPGVNSFTLNRVIGSAPSTIYGNLLANGNVWLINSNGILFGNGARINVGGLIATTADISDSDFTSGNFSFSGASGASVVNQGTIRTRNRGSVVLSGASVSNQGLIQADTGTVVLGGASAFTVDFTGDGLLRYQVTAPAAPATNGKPGVSNSGTIQATGGHVLMTARAAASVTDAVVNNTGMISATSARVQNGEVILDAGDGDVNAGGTIDASGTGSGQTGGSVAITGRNVTVADNTKIDVSGDSGGGTVKIGGDLHGGGTLPTAQNTTVGTATIKADAIRKGNGGTVVIWSDGHTDVAASISARGGAKGGNGGLVETSGHNLNVAATTTVDTSAPAGATGNWLLDPDYINIENDGEADLADGTLPVGADAGGTDYIAPSTITNALETTNVTLEARYDITVHDAVDYSSSHALALLAGGNITVEADVQNSGTGAITLAAGWDTTTDLSSLLTTPNAYGNGGTITIGGEGAGGRVSVGTEGGILTALTGDLNIAAVHGAAQLGYYGGGGMGAITVLATGGVTLTASASGGCDGCSAQIGNGGVQVQGDNGGDITVNAQGDVTLTAGAEAYSFAQIGNGGDSSNGDDSGTVFVSAGGSLTINGSNDYAQIGNGGWGVAGVASGNVTVQATGDIVLTGDPSGSFGSIQIGNGGQRADGSFSGDVTVTAGGDLTLTGGGNADFVQIGNGAADGSAGTGSSTGNASGDISVHVGGQVTFDNESGGAAWLGNFAADGGTESGNVTLIAGSGAGNADFGQNIAADLSGGDFTLGITDDELDAPGLEYDSPHTLNLLSTGDIYVSSSIVNSGTGSINMVAGWDGTTLDPAHFGDAGAFGNNCAFLSVGGPDADGDVIVGSAGGAVDLFSKDIDLEADYGNVQVGYHGAGGGDINLLATGDVTLSAQDDEDGTYSVMVGNGALDGSVDGQVTGNVSVLAQGTLFLDVYTGNVDCGDCDYQPPLGGPPSFNAGSPLLGIGNTGGSGGPAPTGNVTIVSYEINDDADSLGGIIGADLGYGNFTLGQLGSGKPLKIDNDFEYDSPYTLSLLSTGDIDISANLENDGAGAINLVAGWDGTTLDAAHFGDSGAFGIEGGTVNVGGSTAEGDVAVGSAGGPLNIFAGNLSLSAENGFAQVGYHGAGGGDINVTVTQNINGFGSSDTDYSVQLGNGTLGDDVEGDVTGNIHLEAGNQTAFFSIEGASWLGNHASEGYKASGNLTSLSTTGSYSSDYLEADMGTSADTGGDVFIGFHSDPAAVGFRISDIEYSSPHDFVFATAASLDVVGSVINHGSGAITLVSGWDGTTVGTGQQILDAGAYGLNGTVMNIGGDHNYSIGDFHFSNNQTSNISVGSAGGATYVLGGTINVAPAEGYYAQIGYHGAGGGNIYVAATGDLMLTSGPSQSEYAMIGNGSPLGDVDGDITGNIDIRVGGTTTLDSSEGEGKAWIGNLAGEDSSETGNVTLITGDLDGDSSFNGNIVADLGGGDVTIGITDSEATTLIDGTALLYSSSHTLNLLDAGSFTIASSIQNSGSGDINIVAGWNGTTLDPAHFFDANVFGNNHGGITIGGDNIGSVGVGSAGGTTHVAGATVTLSAGNGFARLGYGGASGGAIYVDATGAVSLLGGEDPGDYAQIGNGTTFLSNAAGGDVSIVAGSIVTTANADVTAANLSLDATGGDIGAVGDGLKFNATTLQLTSADHNTYLNAPNTGVSIATMNTAGGGVTLVAGGPITQTGAIHTGTLSLNSGSSDITLNNSDNAFGSLTVTTTGSASFTHSSLLTVQAANVGGTLTLHAGTSINQGGGALVAGSLNATALHGSIVLTNAGNSFGTLTVFDTTGDVTVADSTAVVLAGATVSGKFTLSAGGAITQSAAIHTGDLDVSTTAGAITLTNAGNTFGNLTVATSGTDNATLTDSGSLAVSSAHVGGTLALNAGTGISQSGSIVAAGLNLSSTSGGIALTDSGNNFAALLVSTGSGDATVVDSAAVAVGASTINGKFTLSAGGAVSQTGALAANGLSVNTSSGGIALTNTVNAVSGTVALTAPGAASFYDTLSTTIGATSVGGDFTVLSKGNVTFVSSVQQVTGNLTVVAGWDGSTTAAASFGNSGVYGNASGTIVIGGGSATGPVAVGAKAGTTSLYAANLTIAGINGGAQLGYHGAGGGDILVRLLQDAHITAAGYAAMIGNGSPANDIEGNVTGNIDMRLGGVATFTDGETTQAWLGNVAHSGSETGNVILIASDVDNQGDDLGRYIVAALGGGDVTVGFTGGNDEGPDTPHNYSSAHTLTLLAAGNFVVSGSIQNAGTGAINIVGGWDGHTLSPTAFGTAGVYGNNGKGVIIGGAGAEGNVALGSAGGTTSVYGATLQLLAVNGYAQLGFNGSGSGAIFVTTTGNVTLSGGASAGEFAQIGNGGLRTSGNNGGDIGITAGGDLVLNAGAGAESYVQVGHGGAESNTGSNGYSNVAPITITAVNVLLNAGAGSAAYAQIGNGGYKSGLNIAGGTATNGGNVTVTASHTVSLTGNGSDAYAQIGNGGSQSNMGAAASAGGTDSGVITVTAPNGPGGALTLLAGAGSNAYAQIGNGGYAVNSGPTSTAANWTVTGDITVSDLAITGGGGPNSYGQIGNGDVSHNGFGNISGNIVIDANGQITYQNGGGLHSTATIGNFTGQGTTSGTLTGATPPSEIGGNPVVISVTVSNTAGNNSPTDTITVVSTVVITNTDEGKEDTHTAVTLETPAPGPLASLDSKGADSSTPNSADSATVVIADSLDGAKKVGAQTLLTGMLKQVTPAMGGQVAHGVPPADQDFSSWGNEALWQ